MTTTKNLLWLQVSKSDLKDIVSNKIYYQKHGAGPQHSSNDIKKTYWTSSLWLALQDAVEHKTLVLPTKIHLAIKKLFAKKLGVDPGRVTKATKIDNADNDYIYNLLLTTGNKLLPQRHCKQTKIMSEKSWVYPKHL